MPQSCLPQDLVNNSVCIECLDQKQQLMAQTYLLALLAGVSPNPGALLASASCFGCLSEKQLLMIQASLLCKLTGG